MSFANPQALFLIPILIAFLVALKIFYSHRQKALGQWIDARLWAIIIPEFKKYIFSLRFYSLALALFFVCLALSQPQWGEREETFQSEGMDILVLLDLSTSMNAEDVPPSRLNRAQTFVKKLLSHLPNDRVGIVGFAESAYLAAPLTTDLGYIAEMIDSLDPSAIQNQGTHIGNAIDAAIKAFQRSAEDDQKTTRAMILVTDGEDFGKGAIEAAERVKDFGAGFMVLSVGTTEGAPIPIRNESGILQTYKRDRGEKPILSRANKDLAGQIASAAGGKFVDLINAEDAAQTVAKQLAAYGRGSQKDQKNTVRIDRFQPFLAMGLLFLFLHLFVGYRRKWGWAWKRKVSAAALLLIFTSTAQAQTLDTYLKSKRAQEDYQKGDYESAAQNYDRAHNTDQENATIDFNEATALAKAKRTDDALNRFGESTKKSLSKGDYESAARSLYNDGVTQYEAKHLDESYDRLTKAIEMAKISKQPDVEKKAREALLNVAQEQQKKQDQKQDKKDGQDPKQDSKPDQKPDPDKKDGNGPKQLDTKKRDFHSGTLSKDVAEGIMNDLSDREKQLTHKRLKEQKGREAPHDKDW